MRTRNPLVAALLLSLSTTAQAAEPRNTLSVGASYLQHLGTFRASFMYTMVEVSGLRTLADEGPWSAVQLGGGLRTGWPAPQAHVPLEGFLQVQLGAKLGFWRPAAGLELGLTGFNERRQGAIFLDNRIDGYEEGTLGPAYGAFTATPVSFRLGRFQLSALQLHLGTQLNTLGSGVRVQLGLVSLGGLL